MSEPDATAQVGASVVPCSGNATSNSSGIGGPPGLPATCRASQPSTFSTKAQGLDKAGVARSSPVISATSPVSIHELNSVLDGEI